MNSIICPAFTNYYISEAQLIFTYFFCFLGFYLFIIIIF